MGKQEICHNAGGTHSRKSQKRISGFSRCHIDYNHVRHKEDERSSKVGGCNKDQHMNCRNDRCFHNVSKGIILAQHACHKEHECDLGNLGELERNAVDFDRQLRTAGSKAKHHNDGKHGNSEHSVNPGQIFQKLALSDNDRNDEAEQCGCRQNFVLGHRL